MSQINRTYEFMTADFKNLLADDSPEAAQELEWLLPTASRFVEREATRRGISEWQLLQDRHRIEDPLVQHALDILEAGGFIMPDSE
jgi:hypothetical protein